MWNKRMDGNGQKLEQEQQLQNDIAYATLLGMADIPIQTITQIVQSESELTELQLANSRNNISSHSQSEQSIKNQLQLYMTIQQVEILHEHIFTNLKSVINGQVLWNKNSKYEQFYLLFNDTIMMSRKLNMVRIAQIKCYSHLLDNSSKYSYKEVYNKKYSNIISDFSIAYPQKNKGKPNILMVFKVAEVELPLLKSILQLLQQAKDIICTNTYLQNIKWLIKTQEKLTIVNSKILTICQVFPYACTLPLDDIMCLPDHHERIKFIKKYITIQKYGERAAVYQSFVKIKQSMNIANSFMGILQSTAPNNKNKFKQILKCLFNKETALHQSQHMMSKPSAETPKNIWNLTNKKYLKPFVSLGTLPSIQYSEKIYIPRILKQYFANKGQLPLPSNIYIEDLEKGYKDLKNQKDYKDSILVRINSPYKLYPKYLKSSKQNPVQLDKLIIHFHGSGFVGFSTFVHQAYVRDWAKNIGVPIISVEYGKAPEHPFPSAIQDCLQATVWGIFCFSQLFNVNISKVVLVGDSSGGNLALVLNNILLEWSIFKLSGVVCIYPPLNLNIKSFTPSLLSSINDMILPHTFLKICLKCYLQDPLLKPQQDPLLSPILISQQIIKKYPPIQIFIGDIDAFYDDSIRFIEKVNKISPGKCKLTVFQQFPHGFIMFDMKLSSHEHCEKANKLIQCYIKKLLFD